MRGEQIRADGRAGVADRMVLGSRLTALAPQAEVVRHARLQNAVGYFRYGLRLRAVLETTAPAGH